MNSFLNIISNNTNLIFNKYGSNVVLGSFLTFMNLNKPLVLLLKGKNNTPCLRISSDNFGGKVLYELLKCLLVLNSKLQDKYLSQLAFH
jgi:hypothetical protein